MRNTSVSKFSEIKLGYASAEEESSTRPDLLIEGFFNHDQIIEKLMNEEKFIVLGYKGSGKSAIAQHLKLISHNRHDLFVTDAILADFPYTHFNQIMLGGGDPESEFPTAWTWLLLLLFFDSFTRDEGAEIRNDKKFIEIIELLKSIGLMPTPNIKFLVEMSTKRELKIKIPFVEATFGKERRSDSLRLPIFTSHLEKVASEFRSPNLHFIIIDGLDEVLINPKIQYKTLSALLSTSSKLNRLFRGNSVPLKVIIVCRTDLFERLPSANKNKLRQDCSIILDWYQKPRAC